MTFDRVCWYVFFCATQSCVDASNRILGQADIRPFAAGKQKLLHFNQTGPFRGQDGFLRVGLVSTPGFLHFLHAEGVARHGTVRVTVSESDQERLQVSSARAGERQSFDAVLDHLAHGIVHAADDLEVHLVHRLEITPLGPFVQTIADHLEQCNRTLLGFFTLGTTVSTSSLANCSLKASRNLLYGTSLVNRIGSVDVGSSNASSN